MSQANDEIKLKIPVTDEWDYMFHTKRPFQQRNGVDDCVYFSHTFSEECAEPVWFYSWGNVRWLRCPMGRPGDVLNEAEDRISAIVLRNVKGKWMFVVSVKRAPKDFDKTARARKKS